MYFYPILWLDIYAFQWMCDMWLTCVVHPAPPHKSIYKSESCCRMPTGRLWTLRIEPQGPTPGPTPSDQIEIDKIINRYISKQKMDQTELSRPHPLWCSRLALTIDSPRLSDAECFNVISLKALAHYPNKHRPSPNITNIRPVRIAFGFFGIGTLFFVSKHMESVWVKVGHSLWSGVSLASSGVRVCRHTEHSVLRCSGFR